MKHYNVVAAIIYNTNKYLCVQKGKSRYEYVSFKYEFPGGKVEKGESKEQALRREIEEELQMVISVEDLFTTVHHKYPDFAITMDSYFCSTSSPSLQLCEHVSFRWLEKKDLHLLDWAAADIPIVKKLQVG
ncbi:(deoxy)nucleoside triphosphate pyrophosphohydrolase [Candidatus Uabimicrobium sp. HlEnr_7]|uniref:(deoxy)nucleoside triphosphate pyrophosphohydrolase n=1 Tax=Candidatus Uabimicrobium helgolandensis TaxID=3095367 RepID=UPI003558CFB5